MGVCTYIRPQEAIDGRVMMTDTYTYTHPCLPLILCAHKHTRTFRGASFMALPGGLQDTLIAVYWRFG